MGQRQGKEVVRRRATLPFVALSLLFLTLAVAIGPRVKLFEGQRLDVLFFILAGAFAIPVPIAVLRIRRE